MSELKQLILVFGLMHGDVNYNSGCNFPISRGGVQFDILKSRLAMLKPSNPLVLAFFSLPFSASENQQSPSWMIPTTEMPFLGGVEP